MLRCQHTLDLEIAESGDVRNAKTGPCAKQQRRQSSNRALLLVLIEREHCKQKINHRLGKNRRFGESCAVRDTGTRRC